MIPDSIPKPLRAGELARLCGISTDTLRHYERVGVLAHPRRSEAGYRQYPSAAVARVQLVRRALGLGFSLAELARLLCVRDRGGAPCREVRALAARKLEQVEKQLIDLADLRDHLRALLAVWDQRLERTPEGVPAGLLEVELPAVLPRPSKKRRNFMKTPLTLLLAIGFLANAQDPKQHPADHSAVDKRGDRVMGFSHEKTTHHFRLYADGGAIEVEANDPKDTESRDQIQTHLGHIAQMFAGGNFNAPMLVHARTPPGVPVLERLKKEVTYRFEKTDQGGKVLITTKNAEALKALHEFLRFQISDHGTGDPTEVQPGK